MEARSFDQSEPMGLQTAFDMELRRLRRTFPGGARIEDIMRLRALGEIAACLDTPQLVRLSITVNASAPRRPETVRHHRSAR